MIFGIGRVRVACAIHRAAPNATAREQAGETTAPMIAAPVGVAARRAPHFADGHDERFFEQPARVEVGDERGRSLIKGGQEMFLHIGIVAVRIPTVTIGAIVMDGDKTRAGLHEPPRHEAGLPEEMAPVSIAQLGALSPDIERAACLVGSDQRQRAPAVTIERRTRTVVHPPLHAFKLFQQRRTLAHFLERHFGRKPLDLEGEFLVRAIAPVRIVGQIEFVHFGGERIKTAAQPTRVLARATILAALLQSSQPVGQHGIGGKIAVQSTGRILCETFDDAAHRRPVLRRGEKPAAHGHLPAFAGLHVMTAAAVIVEGVGHRADDAVLVGDRGELGQIFGDEQARRARWDGTERPANFLRRLGLQVKCLELTGPAKEEKENDGLGFCVLEMRRRFLRSENFGQRHSEQTRAADLQKLSAADLARTDLQRLTLDCQHDRNLIAFNNTGKPAF